MKAHLLVTCEHAGNRIPDEWRILFESDAKELASHRGWDPGSKEVARAFADALEAPLMMHEVSRLLVDVNRSLDSPTLFGRRIRQLPRSDRDRILEEHYEPYRRRVEEAVAERIGTGPVLHVSIHTFTPVYEGRRRTTDVGLLFDPSRKREREVCEAWQERLRRLLPDLSIHRNRPYRGTSDGLTTTLRHRFSSSSYSGLEVEVRNDRARGPGAYPRRVGRILAEALEEILEAGEGSTRSE